MQGPGTRASEDSSCLSITFSYSSHFKVHIFSELPKVKLHLKFAFLDLSSRRRQIIIITLGHIYLMTLYRYCYITLNEKLENY
jgi:hypothetical protein